MADWESAEKVQKNDAGEYRAMIGGVWVPVAKAQKSATGEYRVMRGAAPSASPAPTPEPKEESGFLGGLGNLVAGGLRGASSIGSTILAPFEAALAGTGQAGAKAARKERLERVESGLQGMGADTESLPYQGGKIAAEIAGTAGVGPAPAVSAATKLLPWFANYAGNVVKGAVTGGAATSIIDPESTAAGAAFGAALPAVVPLVKAGGGLVSNVTGPMRESWRTGQGRKFLDEMLGPDQAKKKVIQAIAARQPGGVTTVADDIAAANVGRTDKFGSPLVSIEDALAAQPHGLSDIAKSVSAQQEAGRMAALQGVKPDLAQSVANRSAVSDPLYRQADQTVVTLDQPFMQLFDRMPKGTVERAADIARMEGKAFQMGNYVPAQQVASSVLDSAGNPIMTNVPAQYPKITGESLHYLKRALSDISNAKDPALGIGRDAQAAARGVLNDFMTQFESKVPVYGQARTSFAKASEPVNQSKVIQAMQDVLSGQGGAERVTPFMNVLGRGEQAMLKRTTGFPRYEAGDLPNVLTGPGQMDAVNRVASELTRDLERKALGQSVDTKHLFEIAEKGKGAVSIPTLLSRPAMLANFVMKKVGRGADEMITEDMGRLMLSDPAAFSAKYLQDIPVSQRQVVIDELMKNFISPAAHVAAPVMSAQ